MINATLRVRDHRLALALAGDIAVGTYLAASKRPTPAHGTAAQTVAVLLVLVGGLMLAWVATSRAMRRLPG